MATPHNLMHIASQFRIQGDIIDIKPLGAGFINDTFIVKTEGDSSDYILQRKNKSIFPDVPAMMDNIVKVTVHIKKKLIDTGGNPLRETLTVIESLDGKPFFKDTEGEYWAMCLFINGSISYDRADSPRLAFMGGKGIGRFQSLLADFNGELSETIPGFHNIRSRFKQWDATVAADPVGRVSELSDEIEWVEARRRQMMDFWEKVEQGIIPKRVTHNDTKISNILFDKDGEVLCVIDLDTVMPGTSLNDFGDAIRSYANTGAEDDPSLDRVNIDMDIFEAYTRGFLSERLDSLTESEIDNLSFSALYITYEQMLRFLMDYIDGDKYYKIDYPKHNLVRTHAQHKLLQSMENNHKKMHDLVTSLAFRQ